VSTVQAFMAGMAVMGVAAIALFVWLNRKHGSELDALEQKLRKEKT